MIVKISLVVLVILVVLFIGFIFYSAENVAPYAIIKPVKSIRMYDPRYNKSNFGLAGDELAIIVQGSVQLSCLYVQSAKPGLKPTMILLHGIADSKESRFGDARRLLDGGFDVLLVDLRAHGRSTGKYCTYGYYESNDIKTAMDTISSKYQIKEFGIWAHSLGAAIALRTMARDTRIKFGVIQSTFASLHDIVYDYMKYFMGIKWKWYMEKALHKAEKIADFNADSINPASDALNITAPVLYVHGTDDERISFENGRRIFQNLKSQDKFFLEVKGAHHNDVAKIGGEGYYKRVFEFLNKETSNFNRDER